ncbi:MAG: MBL fold metallo-hydrolase [bacterium]|nr:MBL fold metallo-hydrolase [bacterium]
MQRAPWSLKLLVPLLVLIGAAVHGAVRDTFPARGTEVPRVVVLDVGQGDAILLDGPGDGAEVLIDGGPDGDRIIEKLEEYLGRDRTLDLVVLTHAHADHVAGLVEVLRRYDVRQVMLTGAVHTTQTHERFLDGIARDYTAVVRGIAGERLAIGPFTLDVLAPLTDLQGVRVENLNSSSIVLMLTADAADGPHRILLTGDMEEDIEGALLAASCAAASELPCPALAAEVLKVGHHGSETSSTEAFLRVVAPQHAIVSVGARNDYGHPHRRALKRLERIGASIWRTDRDGDVAISFGEDLRVIGQH